MGIPFQREIVSWALHAAVGAALGALADRLSSDVCPEVLGSACGYWGVITGTGLGVLKKLGYLPRRRESNAEVIAKARQASTEAAPEEPEFQVLENPTPGRSPDREPGHDDGY